MVNFRTLRSVFTTPFLPVYIKVCSVGVVITCVCCCFFVVVILCVCVCVCVIIIVISFVGLGFLIPVYFVFKNELSSGTLLGHTVKSGWIYFISM